MKHSTHHMLIAVVLSIFFLLFTTIGYGKYSDSITATGTITWILPSDSSEAANQFGDAPASLDAPIGDEEQAAPLENPESAPAPNVPDKTQDTPQETFVPVNIIFEPEVSASSVFFKNSESASKEISAPNFSYSYTDRSGNHVQKENNVVCHWKNRTLVVYANVYIPQNGLPGTPILTNMNLNLGAGIRIENTTGTDILLSRNSVSGDMEQSFFNDAEGKLAENSVRLAPGHIGIVSAYLGQGWQLNASELDLENLPGLSCTREYKMSFQVENPQTGESRTYAILLVISVSTLTPAEIPLPTEGEEVMVTPTPAPVATDLPAVEPTPSPVLIEESIPTPVPEATGLPAIEPTPSTVSTEEITPTPAPEATGLPVVEPTPNTVSTEEITPTLAPAAGLTPGPVSTKAAVPASTLENTPAMSLEVGPTPEPATETQAKPPELTPEVRDASDDVFTPAETTITETAPAMEPPPEPIPAPAGEL